MNDPLSKAQLDYLKKRSRHKRIVLAGQILIFFLFVGIWELTARRSAAFP